MKEIIVKEENRNKINDVLVEVQRRCTARTITVQNIFDICTDLFDRYGISKKALEGCVFYIDYHAQHFANAYKYIPESTHIKLRYHNGSFRVTDVYRCNTATTPNSAVEARLTDEAKDALIKRFTVFGM